MEKQELLNTLQALHDNLSNAEQVDPDAERLLLAVTDEIRRLLDDDQEDPEEDSGTLSSSLQAMVLDWEAEHPRIARLIGQAATALANLGI